MLKIIIFSPQKGVEFRHSTNTQCFKFRLKTRNGHVNIRSSLVFNSGDGLRPSISLSQYNLEDITCIVEPNSVHRLCSLGKNNL